MKSEVNIPDYIYNYIDLIRQDFSFENKSVLEIGGSNIPYDLVMDKLKVKLWVCVDLVTSPGGEYQMKQNPEHYTRLGLKKFTDFETLPKQGYIIFNEPAEHIPEYFFEKFDLVISLNAFEHILNLTEVLDKAYKCLKKEGYLEAIFGPIWSSCAGSKFHIDDNFYFDKPDPLPYWSHLLYDREEIEIILKRYNFSEEVVKNVLWQFYDSNHINRLFYEDYVKIMNDSPFQSFQIIKMFPREVPDYVQRELELRYPGKKEFSAYALRIRAVKRENEPRRRGIFKQCFFITGSGRSGTSCLAGLFDNGEYYFGDNLYPPSPSNPKGFYENAEINGLNETIILESLMKKLDIYTIEHIEREFKPGQLWLLALPLNFRPEPSIDSIYHIRSLVSRKPYCYKDPRFAYTLEAWLREDPEAVVLCIFREPSKTVDSILREIRNSKYLMNVKINLSTAFSIWQNIYLRMLNLYLKYNKVYFIHYNDLFDDNKLDELEDLFSIKLNRQFPEKHLSRSNPDFSADSISQKIYDTMVLLNSKNFGIDRQSGLVIVSELFNFLQKTKFSIPLQWQNVPKSIFPLDIKLIHDDKRLLVNFVDNLGENWFDLSKGKLRLQFQIVTLFNDVPTTGISIFSECSNSYLSISKQKIASPYVGERHKDIPWSKESRFVIDIELKDFNQKLEALHLFAETPDGYRLIGYIKKR